MSVFSARARVGVAAAATAATVLAGVAAGVPGLATASPRPEPLNHGPLHLQKSERQGAHATGRLVDREVRRQAYLLRLDTRATSRTFALAGGKGATARSAAKTQLSTIRSAQRAVIGALPNQTDVLYRTHAVLAGVAVTTRAANVGSLRDLPGVAKVYPIAPKTAADSYAMPLQGAPAAWAGHGATGDGQRIAVIDSGIDYTHANFGGPGTPEAYAEELAGSDDATNTSEVFPSGKVVAGYDYAGNDYDADDPESQAVPDPNPLDCDEHGSHVAGIAAGLGVKADGTTYTGGYGTDTPFATMRIGPGMAPEADLYAYKVFGCAGTTYLASQAIDAAVDPNRDGDPSDHVDVINLSLGADYGSPEDGDSIAVNAAVGAGVVVTSASGNGGDYQDVGSSPGNAVKPITVANTQDASSVLDGVTVRLGSTGPVTYGATRSVQYDWDRGTDLTGTLVQAPAGNPTACSAFSPDDAAVVEGRVVVVTWTQEALECASATRGLNLRNAGATGFIFHNSAESFSAGINGDTSIPGVLVTKSGGDAIRASLDNGEEVTVSGTSAAGFTQTQPGDDDLVNVSTSRGIHRTGNVKPDVAAVGTTVFSTSIGTGSGGISFSGTSMAAPAVAGLAALLRAEHPAWTPEMVKAGIMNTAGQDVWTGQNHTGTRYAPNRVGAGRIQADRALQSDVVAYSADDAGAVSVSFGPVEVDGPLTMEKPITVQNTGATAQTYAVSYDAITTVPGVAYTVSPTSVTVPAGQKATVTVALEASSRGALTKTVDPTIGRMGIASSLPRETLSDASGRVLLTPQTGPQLRVPVYSAPRPVSDMGQADELKMPAGATQTATMSLDGEDLGDGANGTDDSDPANDIFSIAAGFELAATDAPQPLCTESVTDECIRLPENRSADVKYVGVTSDYPLHEDQSVSQAFFALSTHAPWSIPASKVEFDVYLDVDGDRGPDLVAYTTRLDTDDLFVVDLYDLATQTVIDSELVNNRFGDVDSALYDSDSMILPVWLEKLEAYDVGPDNPRVGYGIEAYSADTGLIDTVGLDEATGEVTLSADLFAPGVSVTDSEGYGPLVLDKHAAQVTVTRNAASYADDEGQGLLMLHLHNRVGDKAQVVALTDEAIVPTDDPTPTPTTTPTTTPTGTPTDWPTPTQTGTAPPPKVATTTSVKKPPTAPRFTADFKVHVVVGADGMTPTGKVDILQRGVTIARGRLVGGKVSIKLTKNLKIGKHRLLAAYRGADTAKPSRKRFTIRVVAG